MRFRNSASLAAAAVFLWGAAAAPQSISIQLENGAFKVSGWTAPPQAPSAGWPSLFAVYAGPGNIPPMLGAYGIEAGALVFHPQFPLAPGVHYRAVFRGAGAPMERVFDGPAKDVRRLTRIEAVYPSADVLPSNLLRLYVYFSAPMTQGEAGRRMHLLNEQGRELPGIFLPHEELWDPRFRRLTMTFDPGRIKRGLTSNVAMGPPIVEGKRYTLVIEAAWLDARDVPLVAGFRKTFRGGPAERSKPDPKAWRVTAPRAGTVTPLIVDFPRPLNYVLLQRMIAVAGVQGTAATARQETQWRFTPALAWKAGDHEILIDTALEDLAGNSLTHLFDIDVFNEVTASIAKSQVTLRFQIR